MHNKIITLAFINNSINIKERILYNPKKKTHNEKKPNQNPPCRFVPLRRKNLHLKLFIGNTTRAAAPPPGAVPAVFILILLGVVQAPGEAAAAQRTWQRAPVQIQILLWENTREREDVKTFTCTWGMVVPRSKISCPLISSPAPFYSSAQTARNDSKSEGRQEDSSEAGNQHREQTGRQCWWNTSPSAELTLSFSRSSLIC